MHAEKAGFSHSCCRAREQFSTWHTTTYYTGGEGPGDKQTTQQGFGALPFPTIRSCLRCSCELSSTPTWQCRVSPYSLGPCGRRKASVPPVTCARAEPRRNVVWKFLLHGALLILSMHTTCLLGSVLGQAVLNEEKWILK